MKRPNFLIIGPLAEHVDMLWEYLLSQGYTPLSSANLVRLMADFSAWLHRKRLSPTGLTEEQVGCFLRHRRRTYTCWHTRRALEPIFGCLIKSQVLQLCASKCTPRDFPDGMLEQYSEYLSCERNVSDSVNRFYCKTASEFLDKSLKGKGKLTSLKAADVTNFIFATHQSYSVATCKLVVTALRSILRFLFITGKLDRDLSVAVPAVAGWRLSSLPKSLTRDEVERLLARCDRRTPKGRLSYAVLLLMVRLGLRACEVAALTLDEISWREGELKVRGKGGRVEALPLPRDVGGAISKYIKFTRQRINSRAVFISTRAPNKGLSSSGVKRIVAVACRKASISPGGAHRLRHTTATEMLRKGVPIPKIAQVLRHRDIGTTAIYAKVDYDSLRTVAEPWPGGAA